MYIESITPKQLASFQGILIPVKPDSFHTVKKIFFSVFRGNQFSLLVQIVIKSILLIPLSLSLGGVDQNSLPDKLGLFKLLTSCDKFKWPSLFKLRSIGWSCSEATSGNVKKRETYKRNVNCVFAQLRGFSNLGISTPGTHFDFQELKYV